MSRFFDELESQLRAAAEDRASASAGRRVGALGRRFPRIRGRRPAWWPASIDLAPVLATAVVILVVGAALVLLGRAGGHQSPPPASRPPTPNAGLAGQLEKTPQKQLRREFAYIAAATKGVLGSPECQVQQPTGVSLVHGTPDRTLLSLLAVLRRPATPADRVNPSMFTGIPDVYAGSARRAFSAGGETYYLAVSGFDEAATIPPERCFALQTRALAQYLPNIPPALRAQTQALQAGYMAYDRRIATQGPRDGICIVDTGRSDNGASCGTTAAEIKDGLPPNDENGVFEGVVPDGVASVRLAFPASHGRPARSVTGPVMGNVYAIRVTGAGQAPPAEPAVTWRSAQGGVVKTVPFPTPALEREACRQQAVACAMFQDGGLVQTSSSSSSGTETARSAPTAH
jgi:hypothetical protein